MQSNNKKTIDTRTFGDIYNSLNVEDRQELFRQMHIANICNTRQTVWNWANGKSKPGQRLVMNSLVRVLGRFLGCTVSAHTLFPKTNKN